MVIVDKLLAYNKGIGDFWMNFNGLELMLRLVLYRRSGGNTRDPNLFKPRTVGEELPDNAIYNYDSFKQICQKFNATLSVTDKIDFSDIEKFRDAIAHGRTMGDDLGNIITTKYSRASGGKVKVEYYNTFTPEAVNSLVERAGSLMKEISIKHLGATVA